MMDKVLRITLLLDFYGDLLTEKQSAAIELYYLNDLSLNEIAEAWGVTPQSVRDLLRRTEKILEHYEEKLKLMEKYSAHKQKCRELMACLESLTDRLEKRLGKELEYMGIVGEIKTKLMELDEN